MNILYGTDEERRRILGIHFIAALENAKKICYLTYGTSRDVLLRWLSDVGPGLESIAAREQLVIWATIEFDYYLDFFRAELRSAEQAGYDGLYVCLDIGSVSDGVSNHAVLLGHENRLADLFAEGELVGLTLVCHYDQRRRSDQQLQELMRCHSVALTARQAEHREPLLRITPLKKQPGLRLSGEIDESNLAQLTTALKSAFHDDHDFHLDLTDLHYVDVATVKLLARTATQLRDGRRFVLRSPGPLVCTILRIYGWDKLPTLSVVTGTEGR